MSMVIGLKSSDGRVLGDLNEEPYASMRQKGKYIPVADDLKKEMNRRAVLCGIDPFKNKYYSKAKCQEWLEGNPVTGKLDVDFLLATEKLIYEELNSEIEERKEIESERNKANGVWNTPEPWMRLYHCLTDDRCRDALMAKDMVLDRAALDARNNEERPKTVWEEAAALYNDPCIVYHTKALPELHMFFAESKQLCFEDMPGGEITPEQVKSRYSQARAELIPVSKKNLCLQLHAYMSFNKTSFNQSPLRLSGIGRRVVMDSVSVARKTKSGATIMRLIIYKTGTIVVLFYLMVPTIENTCCTSGICLKKVVCLAIC